MRLKPIFNLTLMAIVVPTIAIILTFSSSCSPAEVVKQEESAEETAEVVPDQEYSSDERSTEKEPLEGQKTLSPSYIDVSPKEAKKLIEDDPEMIIIDVSPSYDQGHLPGAVNYYVGDGSLDVAIPDLDPDAKYLVYCHSDSASIAGAQKLIDAGFKEVYRLEGNYSAWVAAGYEIQKTESGEVIEEMNITSTEFKDQGMIPAKYTCDGENINPPLTFMGIPSEAKSLVLIVDDPDAPGGTWLHWTVWNIDPASSGIEEGSTPSGSIEGVTDFGKPGYGGPCPPSGTHRYFFKLYALDINLDLDASASMEDLISAMEGHVLQDSELIGLYERS